MSKSKSIAKNSWFSRLWAHNGGKSDRARKRTANRLRIEKLESRRLLTQFIVTGQPGGTLRDRINEANSNSGADEIIFAPTTDGIVFFQTSGPITITESLTITGNGAAKSIVDAGQTSRIFIITNTAVDVTISGMTLKGGKVTGQTTFGGAIFSEATGLLTISHSTLSGNSVNASDPEGLTEGGGGAVLSKGPLSIVDSVFSGNATNGNFVEGGAIWSGGGVTVTRSTITGNSTTGRLSKGGAIYAFANTPVTVNQSTLSGNFTSGENADGGAIFAKSGGDVIVNQSTLSGNRTTGIHSDGGAIYAGLGDDVIVTKSTLSGNSTTEFDADGGAIYVARNADLTISQSTLSGNSTAVNGASGGAIYGFENNAIILSQSTLSGNSTAGTQSDGGAIAAVSGFLTISQSTLTLNNAAQSQGGAVYSNGAAVNIKNSIIAVNTDNGAAPDVRKSGSASAPLTVLSSLIGRNNGTGLIAAGPNPDSSGNLIGGATPAEAIDPLLGPLRNNGGPTQTHAVPFIPVQSPALDRGSNTLAVDVTQPSNPPLTNDQRGTPFVRIDLPFQVDMGAYEFQTLDPALFVVTTTVDELDYSNSAVSLREAINSANGSIGADTITFATATNGTEFDLSLGEMLVTDSLIITGNGVTNTIIDAQQLSRIFNVTAGDFTLNGVTLKNGKTTENESLTGGGRVGGAGGAIKSSSPNSTLTINQSLLSGNTTTGIRASGGAVFAYYGNLIVSDSTLTGNSTTAQQAMGGAIHARLGDVSVSDSKLTSNGTTFPLSDGGALYARAGAVNITRSTLSGNTTTGGQADGGAVFARFGAMTIRQSTLSENTISGVESVGGAVAAAYGNLTIIQSTISGNQGTGTTGAPGTNFKSRGGGIWVNDSTVKIINSTITKNSASGIGGGLFVETTGTDENLTIHNSIIAENTALQTNDFTAPANPLMNLDVQHSLIGNSTGTSLTETLTGPDSKGNWVGPLGPTVTIDPGLEPLADNGGTTFTHSLKPDSLARNFGLNALAVDVSQVGSPALTEDQRGGTFKRIRDLKVDMGAFEFVSVATGPIVVSTSADELDGNIADGSLSLREAIALANERTGANEITFAPSINGTDLLLSLGQMDITETVTITGNGADKSIIDADQASRIFTVSAGDVTLTGLTLKNGRTTADNQDGGAILFGSTGTLTINSSTLSDNSTTGSNSSGGAIFATNFASVTVNQSTITGNSTTGNTSRGGAIYGFNQNTIKVSQSTISGNSTTNTASTGGAIYAYSGDVLISQSTLTLNNATQSAGGAIYSLNAPITIQNSIVAANTGTAAAPDVRKGVGALTVTASLIGRNNGTGLTATVGTTVDANGNLIGGNTNALRLNPQLAALADNGGPTQTHALLTTSPAINRGRNNLAVDVTQASNPALTSDQRGLPFSRVFNTTVDMGAFELITIAGPIVVSTAMDELDGNLSSGDLSLREAILLANGLPGTNSITFATPINGISVNLSLGQIEITESVTITGNGTANTFIDGQLMSRLFVITGQAVTLNAMTLRNGKTTADFDHGGAIRLDSSGLLTINNSVLMGNSTMGNGATGGAIFANSGAVTISQSTLSGNSTAGDNANGGAIANSSGTVTINQSTVSGNSTTGANATGGAIAAFTGALTVSQSTLSGNSSTGDGAKGGAIYATTGAVSISQSTLSGNFTTGSEANGGAVRATTGALNVVQSTLSGNHTAGANAVGGAIDVFSGAVTLNQSTLSGNSTTGTAAHGGALYAQTGAVTLIQTTVSGNTTTGAGTGGGGLRVNDSIVKIINSTITANTAAGASGGLSINTNGGDKKLTIHNSIIAGNMATTNHDFTAPTAPATNLEVRNSLIGRNNGTTLAATVGTTPGINGNMVGGNSDPLKLSPLLGTLADNGGPTETHALLANSPALDRGSNALAVDATLVGNPPLTTDQRGVGFARIAFGIVDLGAVEKTTLEGTTGDDAFVLTYSSSATTGTVDVTVSTNNGAVVTVGTFPMNAPLPLEGLGGADSVRVVGTTGADTITVTSTGLTVNGAVLTLTSIESRTLAGKAGDDTYRFDADASLGTWTLEDIGGGKETIDLSPTTSFAVKLNLGLVTTQVVNANLRLILGSAFTFEDAIGGSGADTLTGNNLGNTLIGGPGNDILKGGRGSDTLLGGLNDDTYVFENAGTTEADIVTELANQGTDTLSFSAVTTAVTLDLGSSAVQSVHNNRTLKLNSGITFENANGGLANDVLLGNSSANRLSGGNGNNILVGNAGADTLISGVGRDILIGGTGLDNLNGGSGDDILIAGRTTSDANVPNLRTLQAEWISTRPYATRIANLRAGVGSPAVSLKRTINVLNDAGEDDILTGGLGTDWYFRATDDAITDLFAGEVIDLL